MKRTAPTAKEHEAQEWRPTRLPYAESGGLFHYRPANERAGDAPNVCGVCGGERAMPVDERCRFCLDCGATIVPGPKPRKGRRATRPKEMRAIPSYAWTNEKRVETIATALRSERDGYWEETVQPKRVAVGTR